MNQNSNANDKAAMLAKIETINQVDGFDPTPFAVDFTDLNTNETRKRLPVMIQMAWFRLRYPEGKIAVQVTPAKDGVFIATARVYPSYRDPVEFYLAEATASRGYLQDKPSVSPREWAQTAAVGIALRNAGFGLQFAMAGEDFEENAPNEFGTPQNAPTTEQLGTEIMDESYSIEEPPAPELTPEQKLEQAMQTPCPISRYVGKTLGEVFGIDCKAINWLATKFTGDPKIKDAATYICEWSVANASA